MSERDIYVAIMVAAAKNRGITLTPDEVSKLSNDDAISRRALNALDILDWPNQDETPNWGSIRPRRHRTAGNMAI